jgi:DNA processing protein
MNTSEKYYQVALSRIPQIGVVNARRLVSYIGSAAAIFQASRAELQKIPHIGPILAESVFQKFYLQEAEEIVQACVDRQISMLFYLDADYPDRLKHIYDAPLLLYYQGTAQLNQERSLAVVGTRKATDYGKRITQSLVEQSVGCQVVFVSGLAYGIDIEVHKQCLALGVENIAVLAGGFNYVYPSKHKKQLEQMLLHGGVLSEYPLHQKPDPRFFPLRNRIIAGMTDATVVVEAAVKGGALITADYANNYHREVFAVPGNLEKIFSEGCNMLIQKHKATIYTGWEALALHMNWIFEGDRIQTKKQMTLSRLTDDESQLMAILVKEGPCSLDTLAWLVQKKVTDLAITLLNLEFQGLVKALPGYVYRVK